MNNNRFSVLKSTSDRISNAPSNKTSDKTLDRISNTKTLNERIQSVNLTNNIFKQNQKPLHYKNKYPEGSTNTFKMKRQSRQPKQQKKQEFNLQSENFPELNEKKETIKTSVNNELNYLDKIKIEKEKLLENAQLARPGWTILFPKYMNNKQETKLKNLIVSEQENNPYYSLYNARKIMEDRLNYRLELNEILGDISPYWNMDLFGDNISEEDDDEYDYMYDDDENDYINDYE